MEFRWILSSILVIGLLVVSLPFERRYAQHLQEGAHNPGVRFLAGLALLGFAAYDPMLAGLAFLAIFLWIADVQLLSSVSLTRE